MSYFAGMVLSAKEKEIICISTRILYLPEKAGIIVNMSEEKGRLKQHSLLVYTVSVFLVITVLLCAYRMYNKGLTASVDEDVTGTYDISDFTISFANETTSSKQSANIALPGESMPAEGTTAETAVKEEDHALVNINTASAEELMSLKGIGEVKAAAIVEYRRENGKFRSISEVMNVKGIGLKIFENIKDCITVG